MMMKTSADRPIVTFSKLEPRELTGSPVPVWAPKNEGSGKICLLVDSSANGAAAYPSSACPQSLS